MRRSIAVLAALGLEPDVAECCFRVGLGRFTTAAEIETAVQTIGNAIRAHKGEISL